MTKRTVSRGAFLLGGVAVAVLALACTKQGAQGDASKAPETTFTPADAGLTAWDGRGPFRLRFTDFHFEVGTQILIVGDTGTVDHVFSRRETGADGIGFTRWYRATKTLPGPARAELVRLLVAASLPTLKPRYTGGSGYDGTTREYVLSTPAGSASTSTYTLGERPEPPELLPLLAWIEQTSTALENDQAARRTLTDAEHDSLEKQLLPR